MSFEIVDSVLSNINLLFNIGKYLSGGEFSMLCNTNKFSLQLFGYDTLSSFQFWKNAYEKLLHINPIRSYYWDTLIPRKRSGYRSTLFWRDLVLRTEKYKHHSDVIQGAKYSFEILAMLEKNNFKGIHTVEALERACDGTLRGASIFKTLYDMAKKFPRGRTFTKSRIREDLFGDMSISARGPNLGIDIKMRTIGNTSSIAKKMLISGDVKAVRVFCENGEDFNPKDLKLIKKTKKEEILRIIFFHQDTASLIHQLIIDDDVEAMRIVSNMQMKFSFLLTKGIFQEMSNEMFRAALPIFGPRGTIVTVCTYGSIEQLDTVLEEHMAAGIEIDQQEIDKGLLCTTDLEIYKRLVVVGASCSNPNSLLLSAIKSKNRDYISYLLDTHGALPIELSADIFRRAMDNNSEDVVMYMLEQPSLVRVKIQKKHTTHPICATSVKIRKKMLDRYIEDRK